MPSKPRRTLPNIRSALLNRRPGHCHSELPPQIKHLLAGDRASLWAEQEGRQRRDLFRADVAPDRRQVRRHSRRCPAARVQSRRSAPWQPAAHWPRPAEPAAVRLPSMRCRLAHCETLSCGGGRSIAPTRRRTWLRVRGPISSKACWVEAIGGLRQQVVDVALQDGLQQMRIDTDFGGDQARDAGRPIQ